MVGRLRHLALCLMLLLLLLPCAARAQAVDAAQATALQQQFTDWLRSLVGPAIPLPDLPLTITADGDHYRAIVTIPGIGTTATPLQLSARLRPLDGGRWSIEDVALPNQADFTLNIPDTGDGSGGGPASIAIRIGQQKSVSVIDPSLATASTSEVAIDNVDVTSKTSKQEQEQKIAAYRARGSLTPKADGSLDLNLDAIMSGWRSASQVENGTAVAIGAQQFRALAEFIGIRRENMSNAFTAATAMAATFSGRVAQNGAASELTPAEKAKLRQLVEAMSGAWQSMRMEESLDGLQVELAGMGGLSLQHFLLGLGGDAPDGKLHAWLDLRLDGLTTPSLPPKVTAFLPKHIAIRPSLAGVQMADLQKLALDAIADDPDDQTMDDDLAAIFKHGGVDLGIETLAFDLGPATLESKGHVVLLSPSSWHADARVVATGFDDLTSQARTQPEFQQALPVLGVMRSLAKVDGKRLVWDIVSDNGAVLVNGVDLRTLGQDKSKKPQGQKPSR